MNQASNPTNSEKTNLLQFDRLALREHFKALGEKSFHADQVIQWIHQYGIQDFDQMTNLSKSLRAYLKEHAEVRPPALEQEFISQDGTIKWLFVLDDGLRIETVFIPEEGRGTLCISSQAGCSLGCAFCATGTLGCKRNLTLAEIIGQVWYAVRRLSRQNGRHDRAITNVVFMGMGEPLLNYDNVLSAIHLLRDDLAYSFSKYRVTVSTVGIIPAIEKLAKDSDISLAVSLHAPNNVLRNQLIPINQKYPLEELIKTCKSYFPQDSKRATVFEYVMLQGINDTPKQAKELVTLLANVPCKINLIPYNPTPAFPFKTSSEQAIDIFHGILLQAGINTRKRRKRGDDIQAACGQLVGELKDSGHKE